MKKIWKVTGILAFWVSWPALWVYLRGSRRTRVLIICGNEFLVLKGWLGTGNWSLPGGGLHRGEDPQQGAIREVAEETGIKLSEKDMTFISSQTCHNKNIRFTSDVFVAKLDDKPTVKIQRYEIVEYSWQPLDHPSQALSSDARAIVDQWKTTE